MSALQISFAEWHGVQIEITFHPRRWNSVFDHLEIRVFGNGIVPITETGYRSHFLPHGIVDELGGPGEYVLAWLDHEAESVNWKEREQAARQLSLF